MKKKVIIIVTVMLAFLLFFFLGYTLTSKKVVKSENSNLKNQDNVVEKKDDSINSNDGIENKKAEVVQLNSKIGYELLKNFEVTNLYSVEFYKLLESENLSDKVKASLALICIMQGKNYLHMLDFSESDGSTYISKENMQFVIDEIFYNSKDIFSKELIYDFKYDEEKEKYVIPSIGISGDKSNIVVEVPYQILEYNDRYEVFMYRFYISQEFENVVNEDEFSLKIKNEVYYSENMSYKACEIYDEAMSGELENQRETLRKYIDENKINKELCYKVKYTLIKDGTNYKIKAYERI